MLSKKDLAKEFSLVVQQEIKNHNDRILETNCSIEDIRRGIKVLSDNSDKKIANLDSHIAYNESQVMFVKDTNKKTLDEFGRKLNDLSQALDEKIKNICQGMEKRESYFLTIEGFREFQKKIDQWEAHLKLCFDLQKNHIRDEAKKVFDSLFSMIQEKNSAIEAKIKELLEEREDLNRQLDVYAVNNDGLIKEIERLKKRCFILEKNIEHVYTLIERSKGTK